MRLVAGTLALAVAEIEDRDELASLLDAVVPADWPPLTLRDALPLFRELYEAHPDWRGWLGWYAIREEAGLPSVLCGSIGFKGAPDEHGMVEIGYSVLPAYRGQGLASEMVRGLLDWALRQEAVRLIEAETTPGNLASRRVLERNGFRPVGDGLEPGFTRYRRVLED